MCYIRYLVRAEDEHEPISGMHEFHFSDPPLLDCDVSLGHAGRLRTSGKRDAYEKLKSRSITGICPTSIDAYTCGQHLQNEGAGARTNMTRLAF